MLKVRQYENAGPFLATAEPWLVASEAENNIILAVAYLVNDANSPFRKPHYFATVETDDGIEGCAVRSPPDGLYLTAIPAGALPTIVQQLAETTPGVPEVIGPEAAATQFADLWKPGAWFLHSRMCLYTLHRVIPPANPARGALRRGDRADLPIVREWALYYAQEVGTKVDLTAFFTRMLNHGALYLWDDAGPRCLVTVSGLTPSGARISSVYTHPPARGNGYATSAVAAVSQRILDSGKRFCVITADTALPRPNAIYCGLGFEPAGKFVQIHF